MADQTTQVALVIGIFAAIAIVVTAMIVRGRRRARQPIRMTAGDVLFLRVLWRVDQLWISLCLGAALAAVCLAGLAALDHVAHLLPHTRAGHRLGRMIIYGIGGLFVVTTAATFVLADAPDRTIRRLLGRVAALANLRVHTNAQARVWDWADARFPGAADALWTVGSNRMWMLDAARDDAILMVVTHTPKLLAISKRPSDTAVREQVSLHVLWAGAPADEQLGVDLARKLDQMNLTRHRLANGLVLERTTTCKRNRAQVIAEVVDPEQLMSPWHLCASASTRA